MRRRGIGVRLLCLGLSLLFRRREEVVVGGMRVRVGWLGRWLTRLRLGRVRLGIVVSFSSWFLFILIWFGLMGLR